MMSPNVDTSSSIPLCVDLDGTLLRTDLLIESLLLLIKRNPLYMLIAPFWLIRGKAHFKRQIAERVQVDVASLPYNEMLVETLREARSQGRRTVLATASDRSLAERIAAHLGVFDEVVASDGVQNVSGAKKRDVLQKRFGSRRYDYAGNDRVDLIIWQDARRAIVVNARRSVIRQATRSDNVQAVIEDRRPWYRLLPRAIRVHQWAKNILVFVPLLTSHQLGNVAVAAQSIGAFIAFCLCASSVYVLNDLLDLESDRHHKKKRNRPFASGQMPLGLGLALVPVLLAGAIGVSAFLPRIFAIVLALYYVLTLAYSFYFKSILLLDVFFLGGLYTIRVLAGNAATGIPFSHWLLAFSMFMFLSLALVKRFSEAQYLALNNLDKASGRGYRATDVQAIGSLGTTSGFMCILVFSLYIQSPQVAPLYRTPDVLWLLCPLLMYWISRIWMIAYRGKMNSDPVIFALTDRISYSVGLLSFVVLTVATYDWHWLL